MMKKLVTAVLALTLTLGMGLTALAAPSPEKGNGVAGAAADDGSTVVTEALADEKTTVEAAEKEAAATGGSSVKVTVLASAEVTTDRPVTPANPLTVTFNVPTVQAGWTVYAMHLRSDGKWEKLKTIVSEGTVKVTFTSLSPVVFVREETVAAAPAAAAGYSPEWYEEQKAKYAGNSSTAASNAATSAGITSPKTGE